MNDQSIALMGDYAVDWRRDCRKKIEASGLKVFEPSQSAWDNIDYENGDAKQSQIDQLVAEQHKGMKNASAVVFHLSARSASGKESPAFAARCELGFLTGHGIPTFAFIAADVTGRNYLWAQMKPYPHMQRCSSLDEAVNRAVARLMHLSRDETNPTK